MENVSGNIPQAHHGPLRQARVGAYLTDAPPEEVSRLNLGGEEFAVSQQQRLGWVTAPAASATAFAASASMQRQSAADYEIGHHGEWQNSPAQMGPSGWQQARHIGKAALNLWL